MLDSGTTAKATTTNDAVAVLANDAKYMVRRQVVVINEGSVAGFFTINGGVNWLRLPATSSVTIDVSDQPGYHTLQIKRVADGSDLANVWGFAI